MMRTPEKYRVRTGPFGTSEADGCNGVFLLPAAPGRAALRVIASDGAGWEHVSVSNPARCPTWAEMCFVRDLFWAPEACVMQLHPPRSQYVNDHPYCLHLWRPIGIQIPAPPSWMVGGVLGAAPAARLIS